MRSRTEIKVIIGGASSMKNEPAKRVPIKGLAPRLCQTLIGASTSTVVTIHLTTLK